MKPEELSRFKIAVIERGGINKENLPPHVTVGIWAAGASEFVTGCGFDGTVLQRMPYDPITGTPAESVDACVWRAAKQLVPSLPATAPRDTQGRAVGYLVYAGLSEDHCRPVSTDGS